MRSIFYLLGCLLLPLTTLTTGCDSQSGDVHFGPNPGDRIIDEDEAE